MHPLAISFVVLLTTFQPVSAQTSASPDIREQVEALAFDPARFFDLGRETLHLRYRGDDYGWPVWTIAMRRQCDFQGAYKPCRQRHLARMVRSPGSDDAAVRPRWSGQALVRDVEKRVANGDKLAAAIEAAQPEWMEADLLRCPSAQALLNRVGDARWVSPVSIGSLDAKGPPPPLALHADTIEVTIPAYLAYARYVGMVHEGTPAARANDVAQALEPCWIPATDPAPWTKPAGRSGAR